MIKRVAMTILLVGSWLTVAYSDLVVEYGKNGQNVRSQAIGKIEYVSLSDLNQALGGSRYWNPVNKKLVLTIQDRQFKFSLFHLICRLTRKYIT